MLQNLRKQISILSKNIKKPIRKLIQRALEDSDEEDVAIPQIQPQNRDDKSQSLQELLQYDFDQLQISVDEGIPVAYLRNSHIKEQAYVKIQFPGDEQDNLSIFKIVEKDEKQSLIIWMGAKVIELSSTVNQGGVKLGTIMRSFADIIRSSTVSIQERINNYMPEGIARKAAFQSSLVAIFIASITSHSQKFLQNALIPWLSYALQPVFEHFDIHLDIKPLLSDILVSLFNTATFLASITLSATIGGRLGGIPGAAIGGIVGAIVASQMVKRDSSRLDQKGEEVAK
ncbi:hypothetical protein FGO68_gene10171 [Halteria grandinella]|uniref:Uncharacterized protein n=1 Tax=Halteria grandinella TaxID=5974 RepID=A0A8J8T0C1_HALGN|nr:hypothetical protein FGO68_gene10171 [Halteria grandinella]